MVNSYWSQINLSKVDISTQILADPGWLTDSWRATIKKLVVTEKSYKYYYLLRQSFLSLFLWPSFCLFWISSYHVCSAYPYLHRFPPRLVFSVRGQIINEQAGRKESAMIAADMLGLGLRASRYSGCEIFSGTRGNAHATSAKTKSILWLISRYVRQTNKCTLRKITRK